MENFDHIYMLKQKPDVRFGVFRAEVRDVTRDIVTTDLGTVRMATQNSMWSTSYRTASLLVQVYNESRVYCAKNNEDGLGWRVACHEVNEICCGMVICVHGEKFNLDDEGYGWYVDKNECVKECNSRSARDFIYNMCNMRDMYYSDRMLFIKELKDKNYCESYWELNSILMDKAINSIC